MVLGVAASVAVAIGVVWRSQFARPHPGEAHYETYCSECHSRGGVVAMLNQRTGAVERLLMTPHIRRHVSDPHEHAQLIAYLRRETGG